MKAAFFKDRQKFAAAHFTVFHDGDAERLHGHNYTVRVAFEAETLQLGLIAPFAALKAEINRLCAGWDEYVLLPNACPWGTVTRADGQVTFRLETPKLCKTYSFPAEDVQILPCDNVSCENLVTLFAAKLAAVLPAAAPGVTAIEVTIGESSGQEVTVRVPL